MEQTLPSRTISDDEDDQLYLKSQVPGPPHVEPTHAQIMVAWRFGYDWRDGAWLQLSPRECERK